MKIRRIRSSRLTDKKFLKNMLINLFFFYFIYYPLVYFILFYLFYFIYYPLLFNLLSFVSSKFFYYLEKIFFSEIIKFITTKHTYSRFIIYTLLLSRLMIFRQMQSPPCNRICRDIYTHEFRRTDFPHDIDRKYLSNPWY